MKKLLCILLGCLSLTLCSCGATTPAYTIEFSYLPMYNGNMELKSFTPPSQAVEYGIAIYKIKNAKNADVLINYEKILMLDGWSIYEDNKPHSLGVEKDTHYANLVPQQSENNAFLTIISK